LGGRRDGEGFYMLGKHSRSYITVDKILEGSEEEEEEVLCIPLP
jgi:hypothetical protein